MLDLRSEIAAALPAGAFLKRDRGDALFVTDAPRLYPETDWPGLMAKAGFACAVENGLAHLSPGAVWLKRLEEAFPEPPDDLCRSLFRFAGLCPEPESLRLFALGAGFWDGEADDGRFERQLRRRAAQCLRLNAVEPAEHPRGGGLYACALLNHILKEDR